MYRQSDNVDRESAYVAEKLHLDSESVVSGNAVALLVNVSVDPALCCDVEIRRTVYTVLVRVCKSLHDENCVCKVNSSVAVRVAKH